MAVPQLIAADAVGKVASNKATPIVLGIIILGAGIGSYFLVWKPLLGFLGVIDSEDDKLEVDVMKLKAFDPNFSDPTKVTLTSQGAKDIAETLYDSVSWYSDNEDKIYNALMSAGTNHNMSTVSRFFAAKYNKALSSYLVDNLNVSEMNKVIDIVNKF